MQLNPLFTQSSTPSPTLAINERVNQLWASGQTVYHLGFGESRFPVHPKLSAALQANIQRTSYLATQGLPELRAAASAFYTKFMGIPATPTEMIIASGSKPLLYATQMALDADVLLPTPSWVSYEPQARLLGKRVLHIPASPLDHYALTPDALRQTARQSSNPNRLLVLNSPSNPTGQMFDAALLQELCEVCRQEKITILSDEIYALTAHGHRAHLSPAHFYPEGTIVLGGLSKHLSLGGWRLGVAITPPGAQGEALMKALRVIAGEIWSTPAAPMQYAAVTAYSGDDEIMAYIAECASIHAVRTQHLWSWLVELGISCGQPDGAFYLFPNFDPWRSALATRNVHNPNDLAAYLLENHHIATLPGTAFGVPGSELSLRLATSYVDMEDGEKAAGVLDAWRRNPGAERFMADHHPVMQETVEQFRAFVDSLKGSVE